MSVVAEAVLASVPLVVLDDPSAVDVLLEGGGPGGGPGGGGPNGPSAWLDEADCVAEADDPPNSLRNELKSESRLDEASLLVAAVVASVLAAVVSELAVVPDAVFDAVVPDAAAVPACRPTSKDFRSLINFAAVVLMLAAPVAEVSPLSVELASVAVGGGPGGGPGGGWDVVALVVELVDDVLLLASAWLARSSWRS